MVSVEKFRELALSFRGAVEQPHFEKASFRTKKRIFATLDEHRRVATLKFSPVDQSVFSSVGKGAIYAVPNKWGKQGWTFMELDKVTEELVWDALETAYNEVRDRH